MASFTEGKRSARARRSRSPSQVRPPSRKSRIIIHAEEDIGGGDRMVTGETDTLTAMDIRMEMATQAIAAGVVVEQSNFHCTHDNDRY